MKFLLDECFSSKANFHSGDFVQSVDVAELGKGAQDDQIMKYVVENKLVLVTHDIRFILEMIAAGLPVIYRYDDTMIFVKSVEIEKCCKYSDPVTFTVHESGSVILP